MCNVFAIMLAGNLSFGIGSIFTFGSTTEFVDFPHEFLIGAALVGLGDAAILNLAIMSKFVLYEKWGWTNKSLGAHSSAIYNLAMNFSSALGTILSGVGDSRESEIPGLGIMCGVCVTVTICLLFCKLVK